MRLWCSRFLLDLVNLWNAIISPHRLLLTEVVCRMADNVGSAEDLAQSCMVDEVLSWAVSTDMPAVGAVHSHSVGYGSRCEVYLELRARWHAVPPPIDLP